MDIGKWAIILGGSSGLGLATASKLASKGFNLCIVHRDRRSDVRQFQEKISHLKKYDITICTFNKDALKAVTRREVLKEFSPSQVGVLVHSIAKGNVKPLQGETYTTLTEEDLLLTVQAMATCWYAWTKDLVQAKLFSADARNIAFTSEGNARVWPSYGAVSMAKSALESLMRQMAVAWGPLGVRTNCIQAGTTNTQSLRAIPNSELLLKQAEQRNPLGRCTIPSDIGNAVALLCTPEAAWINGTVLKVDGGESLR
jgi:NAD(P)-dependent dehydrogenase (short-subunit alcohol dehydrogenase family)